MLTRVPIVKPMVFPVVKYGCESWTTKRLGAKVVMLLKVLEKSLESPLYGKEIKPVNHDGNES